MKKLPIHFKDGYAIGFKMALPDCFRDALDKGAFKTGDTIYDTPEAYRPLWRDAVPHIKYAFKVVSVVGDSVITFNILEASAKRDSLILHNANNVMSGDSFLRLLKLGLNEDLSIPASASIMPVEEPSTVKKPKKKISSRKKDSSLEQVLL